MKIDFDNKREKFMMEHCLELAINYMKNSEYYLDIPVKEAEVLRSIVLESDIK